MRKSFLTVVTLLFGMTAVYGQAYISVSGGYGFEANKKVVGREVTASGVSELKGSYGAGLQTQLRGGYFFTKRLGVELSVGYLHGEDVKTNKSPLVDMKARGRAFGASLSAVFNVTENIYLRAGGVTKIGGKTESFTSLNATIPGIPHTPSSSFIPMVPLKVDFQTNFHGKVPFGFIGGLGYRLKLSDNVSLFVEGEYLMVNVGRKTSKLDNFSATIAGKSISYEQFKKMATAMAQTPAGAIFQSLLPLIEQEYDWSDKNPPVAPYSSIGVNFGLTYTL
ncbi:porin family protein [Capnocytophaga canis]|uniref:porin family protein n=1 Tax=Capnocytophaga canis TaxID=1848903 RepID=UPI0037D53D6D